MKIACNNRTLDVKKLDEVKDMLPQKPERSFRRVFGY